MLLKKYRFVRSKIYCLLETDEGAVRSGVAVGSLLDVDFFIFRRVLQVGVFSRPDEGHQLAEAGLFHLDAVS